MLGGRGGADPGLTTLRSAIDACHPRLLRGRASLIVQGKVIQGMGGCDRYKETGCFISAYDAQTGKQLWKFETVAREGATVIASDNHQGRLDEAVPALQQANDKALNKVEGKLSTRWTQPRSTRRWRRWCVTMAASKFWSMRWAAAW